MNFRSRAILRRSLSVLGVTLLLLPFQNCGIMGRSANQSDSEKLAYGGGTDGKTGSYVNYGLCDDSVGVKNSMVLSADGKSARLLIQDCQPLSNPPVISASDLVFLDSNAFVFESEIYDKHVMSGTQKVTLQVCQAAGNPTIQARIWKTLTSQQSTYFGRILLGSGLDSGDLLVQSPAAGQPNRFITQPGQNSRFDLAVNGATASIIYSINGGAQTSNPNLACLDQASPVIDDGFSRAAAASPQHLSLLNGYQVRPSWKVAGVDYAAGYPAATVLKNPALINMPGVTVDTTNQLIRVFGDNVTLDGYDFTLNGGFGVYVTGAENTKITNSKFSGSAIQTDATSSNLTVSYCNIDGGGSADATSFIYMLGQGHVVMEYNWIRNFPARILLIDSGDSVTMRYNLIEDSFGTSGFNYLYFSGGRTYAPIRVLFNTIYQSRQTGSDSAIGFVLDGISGSTVTAEFAYNTMVTVEANRRPAVGTLVQASTPGTVTAAWLHHNYVDSRGAGAVFAPDPTAGTTNFYSNNFEMNSGAALTTKP